MSDTSNEIKKSVSKKNPYQIVLYVGIGLFVLSIILLLIDYANYGYWSDNIFEHFFSWFFYGAYGYVFILAVVVIIVSVVLDKGGKPKVGTNETLKDDSADIESLVRLKKLLDSGVITQEEFDVKKEKLLK